jgi:uncharacterized membrane protein YhaH (DUF805 family)
MKRLSYKLSKIFSFSGRIGRIEYALSVIFFIALLNLIEGYRFKDYFIVAIIPISMFWLLLAQGSKRCHDMGISGWWQIIPFYFVTMLFLGGDKKANEYGDPV